MTSHPPHDGAVLLVRERGARKAKIECRAESPADRGGTELPRGDHFWSDGDRWVMKVGIDPESHESPDTTDANPPPELLHERILRGDGPHPGEHPWAGVAWDPAAQELHAIRDQLGLIPLFFAATQARAGASSSPTALLRELGIHPSPNLERISAFCLGSDDGGRADFLDEVHRVRPGEHVIVGPTAIEARQWWSAPDPRDESVTSANADPVALLDDHLRRSLESLSGSIVLALSAGLDSTLLATYLAERDDLDVTAVHLGSDLFPSADETALAQSIAGALGLPFDRVSMDEIEMTFGDQSLGPAPFPVGALDRALRDHAAGATLVTGLGSDQLFSASRSLSFRSMARSKKLIEFARQFDLVSARDRRLALASLVDTSEIARDVRGLLHRGEPTEIERREPWMKPSAWIRMTPEPSSTAPLHLRASWEEVVRNAWTADRASATTSRHPYLDPELWRWAAELPNHVRFRRGEDKWLVRELLRQRLPGELGSTIAGREKLQSFNAWAVDRLSSPPPHGSLQQMVSLSVALPITFANRLSAFRRVASSGSTPHATLHTIALWRTLAAERWLERLNRS